MTTTTDTIVKPTGYRVHRNYKDGLFRLLFSKKEDALELYNALNGSSYKDPELIEITTIEGAIYMGIKNDLSFLIEGQMHLLEAQSSWSPNMPLRGLFYFSRLYQGYVAKHQLDVYSHKLLQLPQPVYIVFYNGVDNIPEQMELRLSDAFSTTDDQPAVEVIAHVYNINYGRNRQLMERCQRLHDYTYLIRQVRYYTDQGLTLEAAIDRAVGDCIQQNIMKEFLLKHRGEVCEVILTEYDHELHVRSEKKLSFEEGLAMGEQRGELRGEQRGKQLGIHQERQRSILYMIRDHLEDNIPHERILHRLQTRYQMTTNEANQYLNQVMNEMA